MSPVVSDDGLLLPAETRPLVVEIDGHYVWSLTPSRDGAPSGAGVLVPWPEVLRPYLSGRGRIRIADFSGDDVLYDDEVRLGDGEGALAVVDAAGHRLSVDKVGHLSRSFADVAETVREEILAGTARAIEDLRTYAGVQPYLNYGALLGAIREGRMLGHDSDTDLCYLSKHSSPADIIAESYRITRVMRERGWELLRMSGGDIKLLLPLSDGRACHIDVFVAFHVGDTFFQLGNRSGTLPREAIVPFSTIELHGHEFPAPADPEAMLSFLYGPHWRTPDPSFRYEDPPAGVRRLDGWLRGFRTEMGSWTEFYNSPLAATLPRKASSFARWVAPQLDERPVLDIGAGAGVDTVWLARHGRAVLGVDFSRAALRVLRRRVLRAQRRDRKHRRGEVRTAQLILGELRSTMTLGTQLARDPHHLYARNLVGCLDKAALAQLWVLARMALRPTGGRLFLEFPAAVRGVTEPAGTPGAPNGLLRRSDPEAVRAAIEQAGGVVEHFAVEPGEDMFGEPDPAVCRIRAHWPRPKETR
ncbi:class I SAM-dependent methyltransferase [Nocardioides sp. zg-536]|uniref:Class I SAM-dependent methyltransferase n=1 Tax=Nocardioides faecalis TaxID=2803858 RepID=A0A939BT58_9ACTN|nr:class I SAM-dependent methyltransferase [Nocardioides faecalis]MBM9460314.1 class I SAM-dependent methyltransferase [Nocardioides faecalis]QVI59854.1 class I SAM-dependent methyltransferase [Nocardioides faecalis]